MVRKTLPLCVYVWWKQYEGEDAPVLCAGVTPDLALDGELGHELVGRYELKGRFDVKAHAVVTKHQRGP